ncbi:vitamin B12 dependent-methionine synthase activation domain-containing protein [Candidatus Omnitrophota bacterium]
MNNTILLQSIQYSINKQDVLKQLGYFPQKTAIDSGVEKKVDMSIDEGYILSVPQALYRNFKVDRYDNGYRLVGTEYIIHSPILLRHLGEVECVTLVVCTIGTELEFRVQELIEQKKMTEATLLNAVGGEAVEGVVEQVNEIVRREALLKKMKLRNRFSPGYGDWGLSEQREIMTLLQAERIGITLTEACVMIPEKSVSAIIGWY